jgi:hypothetical protein
MWLASAGLAEDTSAAETRRALKKTSKDCAEWTSACGLLQVPADVETVVQGARQETRA